MAASPLASADPGDPPHPPPAWYPNPGPLSSTSCTADQVLNAVQEVTPDVWAELNAGDARGGKSMIQARNWLLGYLKNQPGNREVNSKAPNSHEYRPYWINEIGDRMGAVAEACGKFPPGGRQR
ncbi:hypothetical protein [Segniliparus rugosus]|uniref:Uncharacterized protein n=1 Tax=Segniliparus rugosus (strain ATCC BAA-974 / DSM 45345 / CCUG 50838 / CIP 108380 / JCM 13579 / CDC 945) TaxID=679197 RepID=E5XUK4_SEGRC|nr:hypothetical protein [Segniliparus rugosus]EFV11983.1 hypothetical protein HMPREF9336_03176 [Segniliparus rugosus ATCC BAA-974]